MDQKIVEDILHMAAADQAMRQGHTPWNHTVDICHTDRMKTIIEQIGWPTKSTVGPEASTKAWLLVQHADHDPEFQRHCLELMKQAGLDDVELSEIAYLEDRVLLNEGKSQLYGTQFQRNAHGVFAPRSIEEEEHLEERRERMGLEPFSLYQQYMMNTHHTKNES